MMRSARDTSKQGRLTVRFFRKSTGSESLRESLKRLTVADDFSHEALDIAVGYGIRGQYVTRLLDMAARFRGYPAAVRVENGPDFARIHAAKCIGWTGAGIFRESEKNMISEPLYRSCAL